MVTFVNKGRLGNFMFQMCTAFAYAKKHGLDFSTPGQPTTPEDVKWNPAYFLNHHKSNGYGNTVEIREKEFFKYDELPFKEEWRKQNIFLKGYFQNLKYFKEYREEIIDTFGICRSALSQRVSIHVRRGDYLTIPDKHIVPDKAWYERAMAYFPEREFVFFSDDIKWCEDNFGERKDCMFVNFDELTDFFMLAACADHINSSSTFSLMAAWLSPNPFKKVITPARWMTPRCTNEWTEDIIPWEWIRLL